MPFLFNDVIFGPVRSRRLGLSLGINLLPLHRKFCSFDCIYCECGWNPEKGKGRVSLPGREQIQTLLRQKLTEMVRTSQLPDVITFAGNGEPTLHPEFESIIVDTIQLRNELAPKSKIAVLSNATMLHKPTVVAALKKVDDNILKLDSGLLETILLLNQPAGKFSLAKLISHLKKFEGGLIIQTMFLRGSYNAINFDNTSENEIVSWINLLKEIKPKMVTIYSIARDTPADHLIGIPLKQLQKIARLVESETAIPVQVSG